jgi:uncharacterized protein (DUF488 family)
MKPRLFTIGVYGFDESGFFKRLLERGIDTFCDIRLRRGLRGARYAFANSASLQKKLRDLGINYIYYRPLAPSKEVRSKQDADDKHKKVKKRERQALSETFIQAYETECLANFDSQAFINELGSQAKRVVLFCVEREPAACHRSLAARKLADELGVEVEHLVP